MTTYTNAVIVVTCPRCGEFVNQNLTRNDFDFCVTQTSEPNEENDWALPSHDVDISIDIHCRCGELIRLDFPDE